MRRAPSDLQLDLPLAAAPGDQLALPLDRAPLPYRLRRGGCSAIRVSVEEGVLSVRAPRHARLPDIEAAVRVRGASVPAPIAHLPPLPRQWRDGAVIPFLGEHMTLSLCAQGETRLDCGRLALALPPNASAQQIRDAVHGWMQEQARCVLGEALAARGQSIEWTLSFARSALCSVDPCGRLRLNWRLVLLSRESIARVLDQAPRQADDENMQIDLLADADNDPTPARTTRTAVPRAAGRR